MDPEPIEELVRAWIQPPKRRRRKTAADVVDGDAAENPTMDQTRLIDLGPSAISLTWDTEEAASIAQHLRLITFEERDGDDIVLAGIGCDPADVSPAEFETIGSYCEAQGLALLTRQEFVDLFFEVADDLRGLVIGQNLAWDIARLALSHGPARSWSAFMRGGFAFDLGGPRRIEMKAAEGGGAFIQLVLPGRDSPEARDRRAGGNVANHRGYFYDVGTVGGAMYGGHPSLKRLGQLLQTEHQKTKFDAFDGPITTESLAYAMNDSRATWEAAKELQTRYDTYALATPIHRIRSAASLGKAYYAEMGLRPWAEVQPEFPDEHVAAGLESYSGGQVATLVRRLATPGTLMDYQAEYAVVSMLMGMWDFHIATGVDVEVEDPAVVQALLDAVTVDDVLKPELWRQLHALVRVEPHGDSYPIRADFPRAGSSTRGRGRSATPTTRNLSQATVVDGPARWLTLADAIGSKLRTGHAPRVLEVRRVRPRAPQPGLRAIDIAGDPRFHVDPYKDDFVKELIRARETYRLEAKALRDAGDEAGAELRAGLAKSLKTVANSLAYGVPIEVNVSPLDQRRPAAVVRPDGTGYVAKVHRAEEHGRWWQPLIGTFVVAGGRLLLEAALTLIREAGGTAVMVDTDGIFASATEDGLPDDPWCQAVGPGEVVPPLLTWDTLRGICARLEPLNPLGGRGSILEFEPENFDPETGAQRTIWCFSIAAKRYALLTPGPNRRPVLVGKAGERKRSEHGLGHLMSPVPETVETPRGGWIDRWWKHLLCRELGIDDPEPEWFDLPAVGPLSVRSRHEEANFRAYNAKRTYEERVRPWGFLIRTFPDRFARMIAGTPGSLVAAYSRDPADWPRREWFSPGDLTGATYRIRTDNPETPIPGTVVVQTYRDYFDEYRIHPESKATAPDGAPCHPWTKGVLGPRCIRITGQRRIGKHANELTEPGAWPARGDADEDYPEPICRWCGTTITPDRIWCSDACRKRSERRSISTPRTCRWCGGILGVGGRKWCSDRCRKRAARKSRSDRRVPPDGGSDGPVTNPPPPAGPPNSRGACSARLGRERHQRFGAT